MRSPDEIIDELIKARAVNGEFWGELIRLAWKAAPERAREISLKINAQDKVVVGLAEELAGKTPEPKSTTTRKAVLLPGGGILHTYAVREALALGLTPVVTDRDPNCPCAKIPGVEFHQIDCYDAEETARLARELLFRKDIKLVGAFCGGADTHVVVAAVHEALGWEGRWVSRKTAETCRDKRLAKEALLAAGVPTAEFTNTTPCILKPRKGSGSRGVRRRLIYTIAFEVAGDDLQEELLEGPEQSVEILLSPVGFRPINIVDRYFAWVDDQPLEWGHTNPTRLDEDNRVRLYELCFLAAKAVGADVGFFKCDTIWTKDGPKVLECTPRLSGGYDSQVSTPASSGRNLLRFGLQLACGLELDWKLLERKKDERVTIIHRPELASASSVSPVT